MTVTSGSGPLSPAAAAAQVFLLDTSASMNAARLTSVRQAVTTALDSLRDGTLFAIVACCDTTSVMYPEQGVGQGDRHRAEVLLDA
jgi:Mg-chelatase subunit ChlD